LSPRVKKLLAVVVATALFAAVFHPLAFIFDTYDYLFRSLHVFAYGSHPFLFPMVLRTLAAIAHPFPAGTLSLLFTGWQLWCVGVLGYVCLEDRWPLARPRRLVTLIPLVVVCILALAFVAAPLLYVTNGYLSEPTAFALLVLTARAFARAVEAKTSPGRWLSSGLLSLVGYHVRYQHAVVPLAAAFSLVVWLIRRRMGARDLVRYALVIGAVLATIPASQRFLAQMLPVDEYGLRHHEVFLRKSVQCTLGCQVRMFQSSCDTEKGRRIIDGVPCWLVLGIPEDEYGAAYPQPAGMLGTLVSLDRQTLITFLTKAPLRYLQQQQGDPLHITGYHFDREVPWFSEHVPDVIAHYAPYFPEGAAEPSALQAAVVRHLEAGYRDGWYHWFTAAALYASCILIFLTRDLTSACLYATTIGTFFLMAYVQPQFPLRYSLHIALPAVVAGLRDALVLLGRGGERSSV
jgi:hypothetical protein